MIKLDDVAGLVLAGGQGRRMGFTQKPLLPLNNRPLISYVLQRSNPQFSSYAVNANDAHEDYAPFGHAVICDQIKGFSGPLAGVHAGMAWAKSIGKSHVITLAGDTPFFPQNILAEFVSTANKTHAEIILAKSFGRVHPVFGLWPVDLAERLQIFMAQGVYKVLAFTDQHNMHTCTFPPHAKTPDLDPFFNINTPEDLAYAEKIISEQL